MLIELATLTSLPTLTTDRLTLRSLADDDVEDLFATFSDPEAMRHWSTPPHPSREETAALITQIRDGFDDRSVLQWGIERDEDGRVLGTVTLLPDGEQPRAELGFILGRQHWGQGYANEAQRRVVDFAFHDLHCIALRATPTRAMWPPCDRSSALGFGSRACSASAG